MTRLERLIALHEGFRKMPYRDTVGLWTVGYGTNLEARGWQNAQIRALEARGGVGKAEALAWLREDLGKASWDAARAFGKSWERLNDAQQGAVLDMIYNLGPGGFAKFRRFISAMRVGDWSLAGREMEDSRWWSQVGRRAWRDQMMILRGQWPEDLPPEDELPDTLQSLSPDPPTTNV